MAASVPFTQQCTNLCPRTGTHGTLADAVAHWASAPLPAAAGSRVDYRRETAYGCAHTRGVDVDAMMRAATQGYAGYSAEESGTQQHWTQAVQFNPPVNFHHTHRHIYSGSSSR